MISKMASTIYLLICVILFTSVSGNEILLKFDFEEEQNGGTEIGNLAKASNLSQYFNEDEFQKLTYIIFKEGYKYASIFNVDSITGSLTSAKRFNREEICPFDEICKLKVDIGVYIKQNSGNDNLVKIIVVSVFLTDINDNTPTFRNSKMTLEVPESVPVGHVLTLSGADDPDIGSNAIQSYRMIPDIGMFELQVIKNLDGSSDLGIVVKRRLDRETMDNFDLKIIAQDGGNPPKSGSVDVRIIVLDNNDNKPQFLNTPFGFTIPEDFPVGKTIVKLAAVDQDLDDNGKLVYSFSTRASDKVKQYLGINEETGDIFPIKALDYESDPTLEFLVDVRDQGNPPKSSQASVKINITDVNDNAPQLTVNLPPASKSISEDAVMGSFVAHLSVFDSDSGLNGEVTCETEDDRFSLLLFSDFAYIFKIMLEKPLDYEETKNVTVNVSCKDKGDPPQSSSTSFTFNVGDENDNAPVFTQKEYRVAFTENNSIGDDIVDLKATDKDSGINAKISYDLVNLTNIVSVDKFSGKLKANIVFDREVQSEYNFLVKASDSGNPIQSTTANVVVIIMDQNDHPPLFTTKHFKFVILENQQPGTYVDRLNATDADNNKNPTFLFSFAPDSVVNDFSIDPYTGFIKTKMVLNREKQGEYEFRVFVTDKEKSTYVDDTLVTITVLDDNDHAPTIIYPNEYNKTVYFPYDSPAGTILLTVEAYDQDAHHNAKVSYSINKGNEKNLFMINKESGDILIRRTINLEEAETYPLVVGAHDNGGKSQKDSYANVNIVLTGGNATLGKYGGSNDGSNNHNMAIVITLIIVTIVLAIAVIVTICIIRKIDRERRKKNTSKMVEVEKACEMQKPFHCMQDSKASDSEDNEIEKLKQKIKNDISFSVQDSDGNFDSSSFTNVTSFTTFTGKNLTSYSSIEQKMLENPQACSSVLSNNTLSPDGGYKKHRHYPDKKREINRLSTETLRPYRGLWLQEQKNQGMSKISEDLTSEISGSTETSERDSGRGGSEEDIHPHSDSDDTKPATTPSNGENSFHDNMDSTPELIHDTSHSFFSQNGTRYHRNISFSDDSVTANTTVDNQKLRTRNFSESCYQTPRTVASLANGRVCNLRRSAMMDSALMGTFTEFTHSALGMAYSVRDIDLTGTMGANDSTVIAMPENDLTNTTSYDHTINAEELCKEIDQLFFNNSKF